MAPRGSRHRGGRAGRVSIVHEESSEIPAR